MLLALLLACSPATPTDQTFHGPGVELIQKVVDEERSQLELRAGSVVRWKRDAATPLFRPVFRDDARYLAEAHSANQATVVIFGPDGQERRVAPLEVVTEEERQVMSESSCGPIWFQGLRFEGEALVVLIKQGPERAPWEPPDPTPPLEVLVDLKTGGLRRRTPPKVVTVEALLEAYRQKPEQRPATALALARKAMLASAHGGDERLRAFALAELPKTSDASLQELMLAILSATSTPADQDWIVSQALKRNWPADAVQSSLRAREPRLRYSRQVLELHLGDANARVRAVLDLAEEPDGLRWVTLGLDDPDRPVSEQALLSLGKVPPSEASFAFTVSQARQPLARAALVERFVASAYTGAPNPWAARFEQACEGAMRRDWPGCEAWTGALADLRGEAGLARARYERAVEAMASEHQQQTIWSSEIDTYFGLRLRLAVLAKAAHQPALVKAHLKAMTSSRWWPNAHLGCLNGTPIELSPSCERAMASEKVWAALAEP
jgi:hypothetical protein